MLEKKHRQIVEKLPEGRQDIFLLGSPKEWAGILSEKAEEEMQVQEEATCGPDTEFGGSRDLQG